MTEKKSLGNRIKGAVNKFASKFGFDLTATFDGESGAIDLPIDMDGETVWASTPQIASLFGIDRTVVSKHIKKIFATEELEKDEATCAIFAQVGREGGREVTRNVEHYSLDVILAVGYRVSGTKATEFRKWASSVLRGYIEKGYALNGRRLDTDPQALLRLAQEVRAIRTSEKNLWAQVREVFKVAAIDYDPNSEEARKFYAECQDVMHYAATEKTASEIIFSRSDARKPNMGLVALGNQKPRKADVTIAKNYLPADELRRMELIGEMFLLYVEGLAERERQVSMARLLAKFRAVVEFNEYPVFPGYGAYRRPTKKQADKHAAAQYELFNRRGGTALPPV